MTDNQTDTHDDQLREWARGMNPLAAATELLIRTGYAQRDRPWVRYDDDRRRPWIDFQAIPELLGGLSGGQQRVLRIAASLGADVPIILADEISGIDRDVVVLVLAAIAHASGTHEPGRSIDFIDGQPRIVAVDALYTWPTTTEAGGEGTGKAYEVKPQRYGEYIRLVENLGGNVIPLGATHAETDQRRAQLRDLNASNYQAARELKPNETWLEDHDGEPVLMLTNDQWAVVVPIPLVLAEDANAVLAEIGYTTTDPIPMYGGPARDDRREARLHPIAVEGE